MPHNIVTLFRAIAATLPERECIVAGERRLRYVDVDERANRFAGYLRRQGLGLRAARDTLRPWESGQDHVALYMHNCPEYLEATLGSAAARAASFNVNYRYVAHELAYLLDDADAKAVVYHARYSRTMAEVVPMLRRAPQLVQVDDGSGEPLPPGAVHYEEVLAASSPEPPVEELSPDDLYVLYTGGTTGMPKGTLWRQADIWMAALGGGEHAPGASVTEIVHAAVTAPPRRTLPLPPLMHGAGHWAALHTMLRGGTVVIQGVTDHLDARDAWETVEREQVTLMLLVGEAFARPLIAELERGSYDTSSLEVVVLGGAPTTPATKARLLALLPGLTIADTAGASETGGVLAQVTTAGSTAEANAFQPGPYTCVVDEDRTRVLAPGHDGVGWLAKRGPIPLGYLGDEKKTSATFVALEGERMAVPGDRARHREDGMIELLGRDSMTVNSGGEKIFVEEVERALLSHPDVEDVLVVGRPSERWGVEVVAVVQFADGREPTDEDLLEATGRELARYKRPKAIVRVPRVRRLPNGKADYAWARSVAGA